MSMRGEGDNVEYAIKSEGRSSHHRGARREKYFIIINRTDETAAALGLESEPVCLWHKVNHGGLTVNMLHQQ